MVNIKHFIHEFNELWLILLVKLESRIYFSFGKVWFDLSQLRLSNQCILWLFRAWVGFRLIIILGPIWNYGLVDLKIFLEPSILLLFLTIKLILSLFLRWRITEGHWTIWNMTLTLTILFILFKVSCLFDLLPLLFSLIEPVDGVNVIPFIVENVWFCVIWEYFLHGDERLLLISLIQFSHLD